MCKCVCREVRVGTAQGSSVCSCVYAVSGESGDGVGTECDAGLGG